MTSYQSGSIIIVDKNSKPKIVSVAVFSSQTGVPESTVRRWAGNGEIQATKVGRKWLIPAAELERIINPKSSKE